MVRKRVRFMDIWNRAIRVSCTLPGYTRTILRTYITYKYTDGVLEARPCYGDILRSINRIETDNGLMGCEIMSEYFVSVVNFLYR